MVGSASSTRSDSRSHDRGDAPTKSSTCCAPAGATIRSTSPARTITRQDPPCCRSRPRDPRSGLVDAPNPPTAARSRGATLPSDRLPRPRTGQRPRRSGSDKTSRHGIHDRCAPDGIREGGTVAYSRRVCRLLEAGTNTWSPRPGARSRRVARVDGRSPASCSESTTDGTRVGALTRCPIVSVAWSVTSRGPPCRRRCRAGCHRPHLQLGVRCYSSVARR